MARTVKMDLSVKSLYGFTENLRTIFRSIATTRLGISQDRIPIGMFTSTYLPYKASKTYRQIMTEFESNRTKAIVEAHRRIFSAL